jgi:hypothetical protein
MATTNAIDARLAEMGVLGQRFLVCRMPAISPEGRRLMCRTSVDNAGRRSDQRQELAAATSELVGPLREQAQMSDPVALLEGSEVEALIAACDVSAAARSPVERSSSWDHELEEGTGDPEAPARLADSTVRLVAGLALLGVERPQRQSIVCKLALGALPSLRRRVLDQLLANAPYPIRVATVMRESGLPQRLVERGLEDLAVHGVAERHETGLSVGNTWALSEWAWRAWSDALRTDP